jgi:hypothetical protein
MSERLLISILPDYEGDAYWITTSTSFANPAVTLARGEPSMKSPMTCSKTACVLGRPHEFGGSDSGIDFLCQAGRLRIGFAF